MAPATARTRAPATGGSPAAAQNPKMAIGTEDLLVARPLETGGAVTVPIPATPTATATAGSVLPTSAAPSPLETASAITAVLGQVPTIGTVPTQESRADGGEEGKENQSEVFANVSLI